MKTKFIFLLFMIPCIMGTNLHAQHAGNNIMAAQSAKEVFDTLASKASYRTVTDSLVAKGMYVSVQKFGDMYKVSAQRLHPIKYVVSDNSALPSKTPEHHNADGTSSVTYFLAEPERGTAHFIFDKEGNILSFEITEYPPLP